jgi:hypothetical protein
MIMFLHQTVAMARFVVMVWGLNAVVMHMITGVGRNGDNSHHSDKEY